MSDIQTELLNAYRFWRQYRSNPASRLSGIDRTAATALQRARADVAEGRKRYPTTGGAWNPPSADDGARWVEDAKRAGLRVVGFADEVATRNYSFGGGINHQGWYTDDDELSGETLRGVVLQLPARKGRPQYLAAYADPNIDGAYRVDMRRGVIEGDIGGAPEGPTYDRTARDVAYAADRFAEIQAERERDWNRASYAGVRFGELGEQIAATRKRALAILGERHAVRGIDAPNLCAAIRERVESMLDEIRDARKERAQLESDFGQESAFQNA